MLLLELQKLLIGQNISGLLQSYNQSYWHVCVFICYSNFLRLSRAEKWYFRMHDSFRDIDVLLTQSVEGKFGKQIGFP